MPDSAAICLAVSALGSFAQRLELPFSDLGGDLRTLRLGGRPISGPERDV